MKIVIIFIIIHHNGFHFIFRHNDSAFVVLIILYNMICFFWVFVQKIYIHSHSFNTRWASILQIQNVSLNCIFIFMLQTIISFICMCLCVYFMYLFGYLFYLVVVVNTFYDIFVLFLFFLLIWSLLYDETGELIIVNNLDSTNYRLLARNQKTKILWTATII